ncbi:hypothetical protein J4734_25645 [Klebsiella pneumoniae]|uniref:Uncharacterized protein n=1 Tax=Klebsiella pneumoniae TaxID=573 RepID=A0A939NRL1_KLEPN|nr:hypothetical protein [Klebsiella pneumoniae]
MVDELALEPFRTGALDRSLTPRSFMTEEQAMLVDWLLEHADLIPVTARGTGKSVGYRSFVRPTTHGAVILRPDGTPDSDWKPMLECLSPTA